MKTLAFLSHKGGVGKTSVALNVAVALTQQGKRVCLLDNDFFGPSLCTFIDPSVKWLNQYLWKNLKPEEILQDVTELWKLKGKLFLGFADPRASAVQSIIQIDQKTSGKMLQKFIKLRKILRDPPYSIDVLLLDSSGGTSFTTVNSMLLTDINVFIVKISNADINGTSQIVLGLNQNLKNKIKILVNQVPSKLIDNEAKKQELGKLISSNFSKKAKDTLTEFVGVIPEDPELIEMEFQAALDSIRGDCVSRLIYVKEKPDNPFSKMLVSYLPKILDEEE